MPGGNGMAMEEPPLEKNNGYNPDGNGSIGDIEYGAEELKLLTPDQRKPGREMRCDHWKIKHVNHFAVQEARVALQRKDTRNVRVRAFFEYQSVKHAV